MSADIRRKTRAFIASASGGAIIVSGAVIWLSVSCIASANQQQAAKSNKTQSGETGKQLYRRYCAVCHGNDGKGNGPPPKSSHFSVPPPDLTTLSQRHDRKFPDAYVLEALRSGGNQPDHGTSEMPAWGSTFKSSGESDKGQANLRIQNLVEYLRSIQAK